MADNLGSVNLDREGIVGRIKVNGHDTVAVGQKTFHHREVGLFTVVNTQIRAK